MKNANPERSGDAKPTELPELAGLPQEDKKPMINHEKRTFKVGITLGAIAGLMGCADPMESDQGTATSDILTENGLSMNGLSMNGLSMNGLSMNGLSMNGLSMNGLATVSGLSSTSGLMTTSGGRDIVKYMVKCAYPTGHTLTKTDALGNSYSFPGTLGVAPELESGLCDVDCQERVSACMLAHVNNAGVHIGLWLDSEGAIGWGQNTDYPYQEGAFFGNLFTQNSWSGYYCLGKDFDAGAVPGRLGNALASSVYVDPFGANVACHNATCAAHSNGDGYDNCSVGGKTWTHVVTAWRNFDANTIYKICDYGTGKCLGTVASSTADGAQIEQRSYTGAKAQTWWVLQVSAGKYKIVNVNSLKALDQDTSATRKVIQKTYTGIPAQLVAIKSLAGTQFGRFNIVPSSGTTVFDMPLMTDGAIAQLDANSTADAAKWTIVPVGALASGGGSGGSGGTNPCAAFCTSPTVFSTAAYQSGNLGTAVSCRETTTTLAGMNCGNMSGRTLSVNGTVVNCAGTNLVAPPKVNGGYCFQASAGGNGAAYFSTW
jgi:hypothetical protein